MQKITSVDVHCAKSGNLTQVKINVNLTVHNIYSTVEFILCTVRLKWIFTWVKFPLLAQCASTAEFIFCINETISSAQKHIYCTSKIRLSLLTDHQHKLGDHHWSPTKKYFIHLSIIVDLFKFDLDSDPRIRFVQ